MYVSVTELEKAQERFHVNLKKKAKPKASALDIGASDLEGLVMDKKELTPKIPGISENTTVGKIIGDKANMVKRKEMLEALSVEPVDFALERAIGKNDSVYTNFVDLLVDAKKKVGRIVIKNESSIKGYATGFMVSDELLLTNWHVFTRKEKVRNSEVQFNYELDKKGDLKKTVSFKFDPDRFYHSNHELDYCLIAVSQLDTKEETNLDEIGYIYLDSTSGKLGNLGEERLNIIHHPQGDFKQLSIRANIFTKIQPTTLWYESDTAQGSSGSPVFNDQWQVVALHHMGIANRDEMGNYLDKDDKIIPKVNGKVDISRVFWIANEGIRISVIRKDLQNLFANHPLVSSIFRKESEPLVNKNEKIEDQSSPVLDSQVPANTNSIHISIPTSVFRENKNISLNLSADGKEDGTAHFNSSSPAMDEMDFESLKLEREIDYSDCRGYKSSFLGSKFRMPIPKPQRKIRDQIAYHVDSRAYILNYHKYSVIHNEYRKMPLISAINIDGDDDKRKDESQRKDKWIRDRRIELEAQLDNKFYKKSGFDRGHMSRREDANWGKTAIEAKRNADLTCTFTNCAPQVKGLNRSNLKGLWGKLENFILDSSLEENGRTGKISVFNGPIFKESDPVFRGVKIPMEFFKVVLWLDKNKKMKATAFRLSQVELVGDIDFEELGFDVEVEFKEFQCSLKHLGELTGIDFKKMQKFDTFVSVNGQETFALKNLKSVSLQA